MKFFRFLKNDKNLDLRQAPNAEHTQLLFAYYTQSYNYFIFHFSDTLFPAELVI